MKHLAALLGLALVLSLLGCDKTDETRCEELDDVIVAKAGQLPTYCDDDIDCLTVDVHAGLTVSANAITEDPELDAAKARRVELCGEFEDDFTTYVSRCENHACTVVVAGTEDRPDTGTDAADAGPCRGHDECARGELCVNGACVGLCTNACVHVEECGEREDLGLGSSLENCIDRCDEFARPVGADGITLTRCLVRSACGTLDSCF